MAFAAPRLISPSNYQSGSASPSGAGSAPAAAPAPVVKPAPLAPGRTFGLATTAARMAGEPIPTRSPLERPQAAVLTQAANARAAVSVTSLATKAPAIPSALRTAGVVGSFLAPAAPSPSTPVLRAVAPSVGGVPLKPAAPTTAAPAPALSPVSRPAPSSRSVSAFGNAGRVTATPQSVTITQDPPTVGASPTAPDTSFTAAPAPDPIPTRVNRLDDSGYNLAPTGYAPLGTSQSPLSVEPSGGFGSQIVIAVVGGLVLWLLTKGGAS